jgi:hypothetical protein
MIPPNGSFKIISNADLSAKTLVPKGTTHIMLTASHSGNSDIGHAHLEIYAAFSDTNPTLDDIALPTNVFIALSNLVAGTSGIKGADADAESVTFARIMG